MRCVEQKTVEKNELLGWSLGDQVLQQRDAGGSAHLVAALRLQQLDGVIGDGRALQVDTPQQPKTAKKN